MSTTTKYWNKLETLPVDLTKAAVLQINNAEFIIAQFCKKGYDEIKKIYKFNHHCNTLLPFIDYPKDFESKYHSITYDIIKHKLYLYEPNANMIMVDMNTKQFEIISNCSAKCYYVPCLLNTEGTTHLIGGADFQHFIWNHNNKIFKKIHQFPDFSYIEDNAAIFVASKNMIVLIGGKFYDQISGESVSMGIWIFFLKFNKWKQIKTKCPWKQATAVLTSDEKYIIIAASQTDSVGDDIFILDIGNNDRFILRKSNICCPKQGYHHIVRTGHNLKDEILVIGFIKCLFKKNDFIDLALPPYCIMALIAKWYNTESIHWLEWNVDDEENEHHTISIHKILSLIDSNVKEEIIDIDIK